MPRLASFLKWQHSPRDSELTLDHHRIALGHHHLLGRGRLAVELEDHLVLADGQLDRLASWAPGSCDSMFLPSTHTSAPVGFEPHAIFPIDFDFAGSTAATTFGLGSTLGSGLGSTLGRRLRAPPWAPLWAGAWAALPPSFP